MEKYIVTYVEPSSPGFAGLTPLQYRKLIWKLDIHLLPPLFALWFVSLIDRVNIGSANIFGIQPDLHMNIKSNDFNIALIIVTIGLITMEIPSNWLLKKTSPSKVLATESLLLGEFLPFVTPVETGFNTYQPFSLLPKVLYTTRRHSTQSDSSSVSSRLA